MSAVRNVWTPAVISDETHLPLPFGGQGLTDSTAAVYGVGALRPIPGWVLDPETVQRRLDAKPADDREVWAALADVLVAVPRLPCGARLDAVQWNLLYALVVLIGALAENLPLPAPRTVALPRQHAPGSYEAGGPFRGWLDSLAADAADLLADPGWVDPDVLVGVVADLYEGLLDYAGAASGWHRITRRRPTQPRRTLRCVRRPGGTGVSVATSP